jgi:hypothetical protein
MPDIYNLDILVSENYFLEDIVFKVYFSSFYSYASEWNIYKTFREDHLRIILVMFGQNPSSGLGGDVVFLKK